MHNNSQLVRNALRMRPDRIIIGEVRGAESFDLLHAMNTGHEGSLSTVHANNCLDALRRLETMSMMAGERVPHPAIREQVRSAIDVVIHQGRLFDGARRVMQVCLVLKDDTYQGANPVLQLQEVFRYRRQEHGTSRAATGTFQQNPSALPPYFKERLSIVE